MRWSPQMTVRRSHGSTEMEGSSRARTTSLETCAWRSGLSHRRSADSSVSILRPYEEKVRP